MTHYPQALVSLDALKDDPANPQMHSDAEIQRLVGAIGAVGFIQPIAVDSNTMTILAGHGRAEAARLLGMTEIPAVLVDDYDASKRRLALIGTNGNYGHFDDDALTGLLRELEADSVDLDLSGIEPFRLDELLSPEAAAGLTDPDEVPETPATPITKRGDILTLGRHRLMCGDATSREDVERLMDGKQADMVWTDPPYGVNYTGGAKPRDQVENDHLGTSIYGDALPHLRFAAADHAALYLWYADAHAAAAAAAAAAAGYVISAQIIWVKNNAQFVTAAHYKGKHEPCFYGHRKGKTARWVGPNNEVTVWEADRANSNDFHPTQKPVALAERSIRNSSESGDIVLDLFGGGGTCLVAAEQTGRVAYLMEIEPAFCDVIVARFEAFTGQAAERPTAATV